MRTKQAPAQTIGVGVVGLGEIGAVHVKGVMNSLHGRLVAICDVNEPLARETAAKTGARSYTHFDEIIADRDVEVVSICLRHDLHYEFAARALDAGKHVLLEKPFAVTVEECEKLAAHAMQAGRKLGVQHQHIFYPPHRRAKEIIDSGAIGEPVFIRLRLGYAEAFPGWRADPAKVGGGTMFDSGVHRVYMAREFFGEIAAVHAFMDVPADQGEEFAVFVLEFASGARGLIEANHWCAEGTCDDSIEICCRRGSLYIAGIEALTYGFRNAPPLLRYQDQTWHEEEVEPGDFEDAVERSIDAYITAVANDDPVPVSAADATATVRVIREAYAQASLWQGARWSA